MTSPNIALSWERCPVATTHCITTECKSGCLLEGAPSAPTHGLTFRPYLQEYSIPLTDDEANALRRYNLQTGGDIYKKLTGGIPGAKRGTQIGITFALDDDRVWCVFITLLSQDDTPAMRDAIAAIIREHLDACVRMAGAAA